MSTTPGFAATPRGANAYLTSGATTDKTGATTTNIVDILTAGASGTKIEQITIQSDGDAADSTILIFLWNGSNYRLWDDIDINNPTASSTTVAGFRFEKRYDSLYLPTSSWKIAAAITVAHTAGGTNVWAHGADF
jgi:hypothetical protein